MAISLARTACELGAATANYVEATGFVKEHGLITGIEARDRETGADLRIRAKVIVNATGIFSDAIRKLDDPQADAWVTKKYRKPWALPA